MELSHKKSDLEKQLELSEAETLTVKNELKIALRRIDDLQAAIGGEMDSDFVSDQVCINLHLKPAYYHSTSNHDGFMDWRTNWSFPRQLLCSV